MTTMPRRTLLSLAALGGAALATGAAVPARAVTEPEWYAPMRDAIAGLPESTATAAQVLVTRPGQAWQGRCGVADVRTGAPVPPGARFRIGSITKAFTATVVLQLAAEGRLALDAPLRRYLPGRLPLRLQRRDRRHAGRRLAGRLLGQRHRREGRVPGPRHRPDHDGSAGPAVSAVSRPR